MSHPVAPIPGSTDCQQKRVAEGGRRLPCGWCAACQAAGEPAPPTDWVREWRLGSRPAAAHLARELVVVAANWMADRCGDGRPITARDMVLFQAIAAAIAAEPAPRAAGHWTCPDCGLTGRVPDATTESPCR